MKSKAWFGLVAALFFSTGCELLWEWYYGDVDEPCADVWEPVCGRDGVTYPNACVARQEGVAVAYRGECEDDCRLDRNVRCEVMCDCPRIWEPVCDAAGTSTRIGASRAAPRPARWSPATSTAAPAPTCGSRSVTREATFTPTAARPAAWARPGCVPAIGRAIRSRPASPARIANAPCCGRPFARPTAPSIPTAAWLPARGSTTSFPAKAEREAEGDEDDDLVRLDRRGLRGGDGTGPLRRGLDGDPLSAGNGAGKGARSRPRPARVLPRTRPRAIRRAGRSRSTRGPRPARERRGLPRGT